LDIGRNFEAGNQEVEIVKNLGDANKKLFETKN
jgi:hypothetical protein